MSYRVVIPTAGIGSRLEKLTKYLNKSLVSIANRPTISHLIEQFPEDCEFVIALGYKGNLVRDFLELAYPKKVFFFVNVDPYEGKGSGLGLSLLSCEQYLEQPFVFLSCDTLVKGKMPALTQNWMGYAERGDYSKYRTLNVIDGEVSEICEKGIIKDNLKAYVGIAGIYDHCTFWQAMHHGENDAINQGEAFGIKVMLESSKVFANKFKWFDTGNLESIKIARKEYSQPDEPNILEKENESIWFVNDNVIKYSDDIKFITNRVERVKELKGFVPQIHASKPNMYCYKKIKGEIISDIITKPIFEDFLKKCKFFWKEKKLIKFKKDQFESNCLNFYKDKTFKRVQLFYEKFKQTDNAEFINDEQMPKLEKLLNDIDWKWVSSGLPGRFHGDFHFENILYSKKDKTFTFLDWRQDFAGDLSVGDIYYDLAKLTHGLIVNHGVIVNELYSASWKGNKIFYELHRKKNLVECEQRFYRWLTENNYDLKKVKLLTGIIYLNIAALHHFPYSLLLYGLGKKILKKELR